MRLCRPTRRLAVTSTQGVDDFLMLRNHHVDPVIVRESRRPRSRSELFRARADEIRKRLRPAR